MFEYFDDDLGVVVVKYHASAKRFIARRVGEQIHVTAPYGFNPGKIPGIIADMKPRLMQLSPRKKELIDEQFTLQTHTFSVKICRTNLFEDKIKMSLANQILTIHIPETADLNKERVQSVLREMIKLAIRQEAKRILPQKTKMFAKKFGLQYKGVKINSSKGRWGSCSREKNINFSFFLLLLPEKYIDYVVLHELAHTKELNHSDRFWNLLSGFCGEDARLISKELKRNIPQSVELLYD